MLARSQTCRPVAAASGGTLTGDVSSAAEPPERVRNLLLQGDNLLKSARPERLKRALEAFEKARGVAADPSVDPRVRELVERRLTSLRQLMDEGA